jgi:diacylglycerol kinase family enzyme
VPGVAVLSNPNSKRSRDTPDLAREMRALLGADGCVIETRTVADVPGAVSECLARTPEILAVNGGDGTLHAVVTALIPACAKAGRALPRIALLRGGTMNTIAKSMRTMAGTPLSILERLAAAHRRGESVNTVERHALDLNGGAEFGFLFGLGLPVNFLRAYYEGERRGAAKGAEVLGRLVASAVTGGAFARRVFSPIPARVSVDGGPGSRKPYTAISAATVTEVGLGFATFRRTVEKPGHFQIIAAAESPLRIALQMHRQYSGERLRGDVLDELVKEARIETEGDADYMIDGEIKRGGRRFVLRAGPRLRFVAGPDRPGRARS